MKDLQALPWLLAGVLAMSGCEDTVIELPASLRSSEPPAVLPNPAPLIEALSDLTDRVVPALPANPRREELDRALQLLGAALGRGMVPSVQSAIERANTALRRYTESVEDDLGTLVDLEAIRHHLNAVTVQTVAAGADGHM